MRALEYGTISWDQTLAMACRLSLRMALDVQAGDIVRTPFYTGNECLTYGDITLVLKNVNRSEYFVASIKIRSLKGHNSV